jgi:nucleoside-diphosphate-sugar epimerase
VARVVLASSETVYGLGSAYGDDPVEEDALLSPDRPYSAAKRYAECLADTYRKEYGVSAVTLRPTGVFGPFRRSFTAFADLFEDPATGDPAQVKGGDTTVSWLYVKEAADAFRRAALAPATELSHDVYSVRGEVATVAEAAETVCELFDAATTEVVNDENYDWSAQRLSLSRSRSDLGYEVDYDLAALARDYADAVRQADGRPPLG